MSIWENVLEFLVRDDWEGPCFAPAGSRPEALAVFDRYYEIAEKAGPAWSAGLAAEAMSRCTCARLAFGVADEQQSTATSQIESCG